MMVTLWYGFGSEWIPCWITHLDRDWQKSSLNYFCQGNNKYQNLLVLSSLLLPKEHSVDLIGLRQKETRKRIILTKGGLSVLVTCLDTSSLTPNKIFIHASGTALSWSESWWVWSLFQEHLDMGWEYNLNGTPVHHRPSHIEILHAHWLIGWLFRIINPPLGWHTFKRL